MKKLLIIVAILFSSLFSHGQKLDVPYIIDSITYIDVVGETTEKAENVSLTFTMKETAYLRIVNGKDTADFKGIKTIGSFATPNGIINKYVLSNLKTNNTVEFGVYHYPDGVNSFAFKMDKSLTIFWVKDDEDESKEEGIKYKND